MIRLIINSIIKNTSFPISHNKYVCLGIGIVKYDLLYKKAGNHWFFKVSSFSPKRALEVAVCQWHAFSNDRSGAEIEPVQGRPGFEQKNKTQLNAVSYFY